MRLRGGTCAGGARRAPRVAAAIALCFACAAHAQGYVAGGDFGRPFEVGATVGRTDVGAALLPGGPVAVWIDADGIVWAPLAGTGAPQRVVRAPNARAISAAAAGGSLAVAWSERDRATGHTLHQLAWNGERALLLDATRAYPMVVVRGSASPLVAFAPRAGGRARLQLVGLEGRATVVRESELAIEGVDAVRDADGNVYLSWLEGIRESTPLGERSDWTAYALVRPPGGAPALPIALGTAAPSDAADGTRVGLDDNPGTSREASVVFPGADGTLRVVDLVVRGGTLRVRGAGPRLGTGRALAVEGGAVLWTSGASVRRRSLAGGPEQGVALSPVTIEHAAAVGGGAGRGAHEALVWEGVRAGGGSAVWASLGGTAFRPGLRDRVAAAMGWNPYFAWAEAAGQLLTSLLIGVLGTVALSPLLWLASLVGAGPLRGLEPRSLGAGAAALLLLAIAAVVAARNVFPPGTFTGAVGGFWAVPAALALAAASGIAALRRGDREPAATVLLAGLLTSFLALALLSFATFRSWAPLVGLAS